MPYISKNNGVTWENMDKFAHGILVIVPGAGTFLNKKAYTGLEQKINDVTYYDTKTRQGGFKYPDGWENITTVNLLDDDDNSLVGLARHIGEDLIKNKKILPRLIIAGSRGGQVVLPLLLQYYWRGPFIAINAGPLTSKSILPKYTIPFCITCGNDYFPTKDNSVVSKRFSKQSVVPGYNLRLTHQDHMPKLDDHILYNICSFLLTDHMNSPSFTDDDYDIYKLYPTIFTVRSLKGYTKILLRKLPISTLSNNIVDHHDNSVQNNDKVILHDSKLDENGYKMFNINTLKADSVDGWIYEMNIKEFQ